VLAQMDGERTQCHADNGPRHGTNNHMPEGLTGRYTEKMNPRASPDPAIPGAKNGSNPSRPRPCLLHLRQTPSFENLTAPGSPVPGHRERPWPSYRAATPGFSRRKIASLLPPPRITCRVPSNRPQSLDTSPISNGALTVFPSDESVYYMYSTGQSSLDRPCLVRSLAPQPGT
jgi:hypothetical protein